jgi:predicted TIM-barrel fold metal-dependent hydrolase
LASQVPYERSEGLYPHGADVLERDLSDGGFSRGWAMHCKPIPQRYFDVHAHFGGETDRPVSEQIRACGSRAAKLMNARALLVLQLRGKKQGAGWPPGGVMDSYPYFELGSLRAGLEGFERSGHFWSVYLDCRSPEPELLRAAAGMGAKCLKLHNAPAIESNIAPDVWLSSDWQDVFRAAAELGLPVLFHVTQRLSASAYTGGGRNAYWEKGWASGAAYTNEDLLQAFLSCCRANPGVDFIGAHQLHVGWERLDGLFAAYPNLCADTSIGCQLRQGDSFYPHDKEYLRGVFQKWADRILFGTDTTWGGAGAGLDEAHCLRHMRFISELDLPEGALRKICFENAERVCRI